MQRVATVAVLLIGGMVVKVSAAEFPTDVKTFLANREQCDHFRGEEAYDEARGAEIDKALDTYCTGTDAALKKLRVKYRKGPPDVAKALAALEDTIE
jgi:hypothetical protein